MKHKREREVLRKKDTSESMGVNFSNRESPKLSNFISYKVGKIMPPLSVC